MGPNTRRLSAALLALLMAVLTTGWPTSASAAVKAPNDPLWGHQWGMRRIGIPAAWAKSQGKGITVAVIDSGVDGHHEDLRTQMSRLEYDTVLDSTTVGDTDGHGTLVAGVIAAAANNKTGVVGVAPKAKIMALRAFPKFDADAGANQTDVAEAIDWAVEHGAQVINLSLGGVVGGPEQLLAVTRAVASGVLVVAAAGNESTPLCGFPAAHPLAICVGATDKLDRPTSFTNYGVRLDVVAPGSSIWSTGYSAKGGPTDQLRKYQAVPGTSFASPFVAGVGALLMSMGASNLQAALILRTSAKDLGLPGYDLTYGFGRLDAKAAVEMCAQIC